MSSPKGSLALKTPSFTANLLSAGSSGNMLPSIAPPPPCSLPPAPASTRFHLLLRHASTNTTSLFSIIALFHSIPFHPSLPDCLSSNFRFAFLLCDCVSSQLIPTRGGHLLSGQGTSAGVKDV
jgi:hypothetical protein